MGSKMALGTILPNFANGKLIENDQNPMITDIQVNLDPFSDKTSSFHSASPEQELNSIAGIFLTGQEPPEVPRDHLERSRYPEAWHCGIAHDSVCAFGFRWISDDFGVMGPTFQRRNLR